MAVRVVNGNTFTEDGWPLVDQAGCTWIHVPGTNVTIQVQSGPPAAILGAWEADWNAFLEPLEDATTGCWTEGNSVLGTPGHNNGSNHLGGTATDSSWERHPFQKRGSFNAAQLATMQEMLDFYEGMVFWAGVDWSEGGWGSPIDEMHSQMGYGTYDQKANRPTPQVFDFIARKIRADGFSTFRRGNAPAHPPAAQVLADATGLSVDRAGVILPTVISGLQASQCNNVNRIAMWLAQCGEESAGFSTTTEFASGAEYEGRGDLGNTQPGDGVRFKGRTWIQITGRAHYAEFSKWAFGKKLCSSPTQFVDNPTSLGDLPWAGIGAAWYWTVSRPDINALSDGGDVLTVTKRINGGTNGLADRQNRYNRAHALGDQLLTLTSPTQGDDDLTPEQDQMLRAINRELTQRLPSRSPLRWLDQKAHYPDGLVDTMAGFELNVDGMTHVQYCVELASYNHPPTMALLNEVAGADPAKYPDRADDIKLAQAILNKVAADKVSKAVGQTPTVAAAPVTINSTITPAIAQDIANKTTVAVLQQLQPVVAAAAPVGGTTGQLIGQAFDSLEALKGAQSDLSPQAKATVDALIGVLQSETGVKA